MKSSSNYQLSKSRKDRKTVTFITAVLAVLAVLASDNLKDSTILMERSGFPFFSFLFLLGEWFIFKPTDNLPAGPHY